MKKITLLILFLIPLLTFSQSNKDIIQKYLHSNSAKSGLSANDLSDWIIESEGTSSNSKITNCYVVQRHNGIEIFRSVSTFSIKEGKVLNAEKKFVANVSKKITGTNPSLSATQALAKAYEQLKIKPTAPFTVLETKSKYKSVLSNGFEKGVPVAANLVYFTAKDKSLVLAWDFTISTTAPEHKWSVRVDAQTGKILEKKDRIISCNFENKKQKSLVYDDVFDDPTPLTYKQIYPKKTPVPNPRKYHVLYHTMMWIRPLDGMR